MEDWEEEEVWAVPWGSQKTGSQPPPAAAPRKVSLSQSRRSAAVSIRRRAAAGEEENSHRKEEEEDSGIIPPHQWIARKTEKKEISSFSMCEGAGRTLKGRDLSRVRTAVLTRTGFLEPSSAR